MVAMTARMDALIAQLRTTPGAKPQSRSSGSAYKRASTFANQGATILANPQCEFTYDPMAFPPLPQPVNRGSMWAPRGISPRAPPFHTSSQHIL